MKTMALIIMVAMLLEALIEYAKTVADMIATGSLRTAITQCLTIALGIGLAFAFKLQLFNGVLVEFYPGLALNQTIDIVLTGILFSRGSNYISDFIGRLTKTNELNSLDRGLLNQFNAEQEEDYIGESFFNDTTKDVGEGVEDEGNDI